eukprot:Phypoly_transcript_11847.p1 GENE.Phypoly_transcript_11847~~Phypoly_transcript_11847.p1  ORF type:complete len:232 (+),score=20.22 Phypoly_transcript_11847:483-1178(+)
MDCSQEAGEFLAELLLHRAYFLVVAKDERFSTDRQCEWGTPLRIAMRVGNIRAIATLVSLCGYQILPPIKWVCPTLNTSKTDESAIYRITVFYSGVIQKNTIFCTNSSMDLYEKLWEFEQYRFLEARWNGAAIYPGNQTLYDMGFCSDDVISVSPQKIISPWIASTIGGYLPPLPPVYKWTPQIHHLFPKIVRDSVICLLLAMKRRDLFLDADTRDKIIQYACFGWISHKT